MCGMLCSSSFVRFICARMWGCGVLPAALPAPFSATLSLALSVYLCANVGPQGLLVVRLLAPFVPYSASLGPATAMRVLSTPVPVSSPPTGLDECLFFISLVSDFLAVRFSVCSGCARRRSVSTYAAILVLLSCSFKPYATSGSPSPQTAMDNKGAGLFLQAKRTLEEECSRTVPPLQEGRSEKS